MPKIIYDAVEYDSQEELDFKHWLDEAYENNLIWWYRRQEKGKDTIQLIKKQYLKNNEKRVAFQPVNYTPDFLVHDNHFTPFLEKETSEGFNYIDVKGGFSRFNDKKQFQLIRKMMYYFKGIYVHIVIPDELFLKTWVPEKCRYTAKTGKIKKKFVNTPTIKEYLKRM